MRLSLFSVLAAGAALVQVGATPIRLEVVNSPDDIPSRLRFGHAFSPSNNADLSRIHVATIVRPDGANYNNKVRTPCKGMKARMQMKAIELSNAFRQALGLPIIETPFAPQPGFVHILPVGGPSFGSFQPIEAGPDGLPRHRPHHHVAHRKRPGCLKNATFLRRIHVALTALGPWEGRAVAFVLGCGIGVLLRMFWVIALVSYRALKGTNDNDNNEYAEIIYVEEVEEPEVPAPAYTDEKAEAGAIKL